MPDYTGGTALLIRAPTKTIAFDGTAGLGQSGTNCNLWTVTGVVMIVHAVARVTETLVGGGGAVLTWGTTASVTAFAASTAYSSLTTTLNLWSETTTAQGAKTMFPTYSFPVNGGVIRLANGVASVTDGTIVFNLLFFPITPDGAVA